jgi:hypothetical protein
VRPVDKNAGSAAALDSGWREVQFLRVRGAAAGADRRGAATTATLPGHTARGLARATPTRAGISRGSGASRSVARAAAGGGPARRSHV